MVSVDLTGIPHYLWVIGVIVTALGGVCIRLLVTVRRLSVTDHTREVIEDERKKREQAVWEAWKQEAETRRQQMQALVQQVLELQTQNGKLHETIFGLQKDLTGVTVENVSLRIKVDDLQKHNVELQTQMTEVVKVTHDTV